MNLLLDTHILIWTLTNNSILSSHAKKMILDENNDLYFSVISLWEIELKRSVHKEEFDFTAEDVYNYCLKADYRQVFLKEDSVFCLSNLIRNDNTSQHKDPFDRMILCQAKANNMFLLTHDKKLTEYNFDNVILV